MVDSRPNVWQMQSRHDTQGLIQALRYPDPEVRGRAAVALRTLDAVPAVPALKVALQDELDEQARKYLKEALHILDQRTDIGLLAQKADMEGLTDALRSPRQETVIASARALGKLGNRLAVEPLVILFHNSTSPPAVRLAAAEALLELKSAPAVVTLLGALRRDSWQVRRNAAAVLGQIQAIWAVEPLAEALNDAHPVVRRTAAAALKRIGTIEAITAMRDALRGDQDSVSRAGADRSQARGEDHGEDRGPTRADRAGDLPSALPVAESEPPARETRYSFDSEPAGLSAADERPLTLSDIPAPEFYDFPDIEVSEAGEVGEAHVTRPSEATHPVGRAQKSSRQAIDANAEVVETAEIAMRSEDSRDVSDDEAKDQTQSPIARMIAFFRRRGGNNQ